MKKFWSSLTVFILTFFTELLTACYAKIELTELFQSHKELDLATNDINNLIEMKMIDKENNKIILMTADINKALNFFLKKEKSLDYYIILSKKPSCIADSSLKNKKAIYVEIKCKTGNNDIPLNDIMLSIDFYLVVYCVWKKNKNTYAWVKTPLNKKLTLAIKSDQSISC